MPTFVGFAVARLLRFRIAADAGMDLEEHPIIVFDGFCVLCSANAQVVLKHDRRGYFRLAAMQEVGRALYRQFGIDPGNPETLIVVTGATALRDSVYRWVARNRYRVFGGRDTGWVPTREQAARIP